MKKKMVKVMGVSLMMSLLISTVSMAATLQGAELTSTAVESQRLPASQRSSDSGMHPETRGRAMATSSMSITNLGWGVIGLQALTTMHIPTSWGMTTIYLDRWNEATQDWDFLKMYEKEYLPKNEADGKLTSMTYTLEVKDQPYGYYYRARGVHELEYIENGHTYWEGASTETNGVMITNTP